MRTVSLVLLLGVGLAGVVGSAEAQETDPQAEDTARARTLFTEGLALAADEEFAEAADRFRAALEIHPTPAIAYNLAAALVKLDLLLEASELVRGVMNDPESSREVRALASQLRPRIDERLARLTVNVDGELGDAEVVLDGRSIREGELGVPIPMDPGDHVVEAVRGTQSLECAETTLEVAGAGEVTLTASSWPPPPAVEIEPEPVPEPGPNFYETWWFWTIVGAVVVGGAVAVILAVSGGTEDPVVGNANPGVITF